MTNGFALNHEKSLQIYFCVKCQAKTTFWKMSKAELNYTTVEPRYLELAYFELPLISK